MNVLDSVKSLGYFGNADCVQQVEKIFNRFKLLDSSLLQKGLTVGISGPPGSGKSFFLDCLLSALQLAHSTTDLEHVYSFPKQLQVDALCKELVKCFKSTEIAVIDDLDLVTNEKHREVIIDFVKKSRFCHHNLVFLIAPNLEPQILDHLDLHIQMTLDSKGRRAILEKLNKQSSQYNDELANLLNGYSFYDIRDMFKSLNHQDCLSIEHYQEYIRSNKPIALRSLEQQGSLHASFDYSMYSLDQLGGVDDIIAKCKKILIEPFSNKSEYLQKGIKMPRGLFIYGPSGTGKTHLAIAMARSSSLSFLHIDAAGLRSKYLGDTEKQISAMFKCARSMAPCIMFLDHIDSLLKGRHSSEGNNNEYDDGNTNSDDRIVTCFLMELDGALSFDNEDVVVLGVATDKASIDPAILRPGRIGIYIHMDYPDESMIVPIIQAILKPLTHDLSKDFIETNLKACCLGLSQSEIKGLIIQAAQGAVLNGRCTLTEQDFSFANQQAQSLSNIQLFPLD